MAAVMAANPRYIKLHQYIEATGLKTLRNSIARLKRFLAARNITAHNFVLDILEVLCRENLPENLKLQLFIPTSRKGF
ncbi:hypothetical protein OS493_036312 [Desmophyllum pertusum]|uniref:Uncharacterized protein n=1 Tax=Desmophyllum pertusum TaxID=174260 RepID=A0A9X0CVV5_9CNID|nr:hypothetical protein OS493_036312 [Desmophyllum pertusum]